MIYIFLTPLCDYKCANPLITEYRYPGEDGIWRWENNQWIFYAEEFTGGDEWIDEHGDNIPSDVP